MKRQLRRITAVLAALAVAAGISVTAVAAPENISAVSAIVIEADDTEPGFFETILSKLGIYV